ncbi:hypothetical protein [Oceanobacillus profundus]|nr:hypothetical protein [Oceanobacillus profundus]MCM3399427.1 hypothetical protein [Oceanobacillus profundus]
MSELKQAVTDILDLANELKEGTIEKMLSKSDFNVSFILIGYSERY